MEGPGPWRESQTSRVWNAHFIGFHRPNLPDKGIAILSQGNCILLHKEQREEPRKNH